MHTRVAVALLFASPCLLFGQTNSFPGFTPGNLVVSRSVYTGNAGTVLAGQALPPICPTTAKCGTVKATDNGAYPTAGATNNVWNNDKADGNFGVTTPIFLDQITPAGKLVNTLPIPPQQLVTSFSSKSELSLNLSTDGTAITFMGYVAPLNAIDVSNSNTPGVYDPTNPVGSSHFRAVGQVGANGALRITPTNAYSGNNGRAAILANGRYYMVGNDNNGSGTPDNIVAATGVQIATPGQPATTLPTAAGHFSIAAYNDPATGKPYAADKAGKDENFRGMTIFNNTLYVTKGSGSNGFDSVYQVGTAGTLPSLSSAPNAPITVLPGFPTVLVRNTDVTYKFPFGIWFANANTLYVADEGDGSVADAAVSQYAGLQKWSLVNGTWQLDYVLQNGLDLGKPYSIPNYPASLYPATGGLRNLTGRVNSDGTVTIWAVTGTVSANGDPGADPNKLVMITDTLSNTAAGGAAGEKFVTLLSAGWGEVLRGVCFAPTAGATPAANSPSILSAATTSAQTIAPGSLAAAYGQLLADPSAPVFAGGPVTIRDLSVAIADSANKTVNATIIGATPNGVTFLVPSLTAPGPATVTLTSVAGAQQSNVQIARVSPGLFTVNNSGLPLAYTVRVAPGGAQTIGEVYTVNSDGVFVPNPISLGSADDLVFVVMYGTGIYWAGTEGVKVTVNGVNAPVYYAGPQGNTTDAYYSGLDQVAFQIPPSQAGKGNVSVLLTAAGIASNPVQITIK